MSFPDPRFGWLRVFASAVIATATCSAVPGQAWVVEDVIDPPTWSQGVSSSWTATWPQPGAASDSRAFFAVAQDEVWPLPTELTLRYQADLGTAISRAHGIGVGGYYDIWSTLLLRAGPGPRVVGKDPLTLYEHRVVDAGTGSVIATLGSPSLGLGTLSPDSTQAAGDINGDGFDEFFLTYYGAGTGSGPLDVVALFDGASLSIVWSKAEHGDFDSHVWHFDRGPVPDLDLDGVPEYVMVEHWLNPSTLVFENKVIALSGADGSEVWRVTVPGISIGPNRFIPDVTGDSIAEIVLSRHDIVVGSDVLAVLDGANGSVVWETPVSIAYSYFTQGPLLAANFWNVVMPGPDPNTGIPEVVSVVFGSYANGDVEWAYLHFDAATGTLRSVASDPPDLSPWFPDPLSANVSIGTDHWPLGDIDRDGLEENAALATAVGWPTNGFQESRRLVILGQETLDCPDQVQLGGTMQLDVGIPSAGGMECVLLAATAFDGGGGLVLDGWKTNLVASDPVLQATLQSRAYSTTLDNLGRGSFTVAVPPIPQLAGKTLYLRAVALEPGTTAEVWTLSTLGVVEIL